jgi:hypothetical protein
MTTSIVVTSVGCGGGDADTSTSTTAPLSKAQFLKQANAACAKERAGLAQRVAKYERLRGGREPAPGADMVHFIFLPTIEAQILRIEEIGVPRGQAGQVGAILDAERRSVDSVAVIQRVPSIAKAVRQFAEADKLLRAYGLDACANGSGRGSK